MRNIKIGIVVADYDEYAPFVESVKKYDLVVVGGGTAGVAAAYIAAKNNLKTLIIEKNIYIPNE